MHLLRVVEGCGLEEFALKARPPNLTTILYDVEISALLKGIRPREKYFYGFKPSHSLRGLPLLVS